MTTDSPAGRTGQPWTSMEDAYLLLHTKNEAVRQMARTLRRTRHDVGARIVHLGLEHQAAARKAELITRHRTIAERDALARQLMADTPSRSVVRIGVVQRWTAKEDELITSGKLTDEQLAIQFRRSANAVYQRRRWLRRREAA